MPPYTHLRYFDSNYCIQDATSSPSEELLLTGALHPDPHSNPPSVSTYPKYLGATASAHTHININGSATTHTDRCYITFAYQHKENSPYFVRWKNSTTLKPLSEEDAEILKYALQKSEKHQEVYDHSIKGNLFLHSIMQRLEHHHTLKHIIPINISLTSNTGDLYTNFLDLYSPFSLPANTWREWFSKRTYHSPLCVFSTIKKKKPELPEVSASHPSTHPLSRFWRACKAYASKCKQYLWPQCTPSYWRVHIASYKLFNLSTRDLQKRYDSAPYWRIFKQCLLLLCVYVLALCVPLLGIPYFGPTQARWVLAACALLIPLQLWNLYHINTRPSLCFPEPTRFHSRCLAKPKNRTYAHQSTKMENSSENECEAPIAHPPYEAPSA